MRRSVKSHSEPVPVDAHERTRDYVTEEEFLALVGAARQSRHHWRNTAMLMLTSTMACASVNYATSSARILS
jgi:hypothetical protein